MYSLTVKKHYPCIYTLKARNTFPLYLSLSLLLFTRSLPADVLAFSCSQLCLYIDSCLLIIQYNEWRHEDRNAPLVWQMGWLFYQRPDQKQLREGRICVGSWLKSLVHYRGKSIAAGNVSAWATCLHLSRSGSRCRQQWGRTMNLTAYLQWPASSQQALLPKGFITFWNIVSICGPIC